MFKRHQAFFPKRLQDYEPTHWTSVPIEKKIVRKNISQLFESPTNGNPGVLSVTIPFCYSYCSFCVFNRVTTRNTTIVDDYIQAVIQEVKSYTTFPAINSTVFDCFFLGLGTPSFLRPEQLELLLTSIRKHFKFSSDAEFTFQCDPVTIKNSDRLKVLHDSGWSNIRLDMGVQTFDPHLRKVLGLKSKQEHVLSAIEFLQDNGFEDVGIDLIYFLPGQTVKNLESDLSMITKLGINHVDFYDLLTIPQNLLYWQLQNREILPLPDEDTRLDMNLLVLDYLQDAGYRNDHYVFEFYKMTSHCKYRVRISGEATTIIPIGVGGFGRIGNRFFTNTNDIHSYPNFVEQHGLAINSIRKLIDPMGWHVYHGLRTLNVDKKNFKHKFGISLGKQYKDVIEKMVGLGFLEETEYVLRPTKLGKLWLFNVALEFCNPALRSKILSFEEELDEIGEEIYESGLSSEDLWRQARVKFNLNT